MISTLGRQLSHQGNELLQINASQLVKVNLKYSCVIAAVYFSHRKIPTSERCHTRCRHCHSTELFYFELSLITKVPMRALNSKY